MNDPPRLQPALSHRTPRASHLPSTSGSPTRQRHTDDLLSRLTPRAAVDALQKPSGELKRCMDAASPAEQAFALRVAVASRSIQEWLQELSSWPWPTYDTSAGFERPPAKRRKLFERSASDDGLDDSMGDTHEKGYLGSLLASDVAAYERRIQDIEQDMEDLDVEEIKNHILHNHIMPLSRPGTPLSDTLRTNNVSAAAYAQMDDFTALITATIVQALPNLSKLTRLLNTWTIRLLVLRKSTGFLTALMDAEIALRAGWKAMGASRDADAETPQDSVTKDSVLSRSEFDTMKRVVERKVAKAGQSLDFMLDVMEGREDTLPEDWLDRMDTVEQGYADWASGCESRIREDELTKVARESLPAPADSSADIERESTAPSVQPGEVASTVQEYLDGAVSDSAFSGVQVQGSEGTLDGIVTPMVPAPAESRSHNHNFNAKHKDETLTRGDDGTTSDLPAIMIHPAAEGATGVLKSDVRSTPTDLAAPKVSSSKGTTESELGSISGNLKDTVPTLDSLNDDGAFVETDLSGSGSYGAVPMLATDATVPISTKDEQSDSPEQAAETGMAEAVTMQTQAQLPEDDDEFPNPELPELDLPVLPYAYERRGSEVSNASTVVHGLRSGFGDLSSDPPDHGTPDNHRFRDVALPSTESDAVDLADDTDLPSSPPDFRSSTRSLSVSFNDIPTLVEAPEEDEDETSPNTPLDASFSAEDELGHPGSPSKMSASSADDQLQQQISEILDSIPAKIRLASETPAINLNPPDFSMPAPRPKARDSVPPRSYSSLSNRSSRAGTPSFTLAPAKNLRPRHQRGNQEIKLYHLSRSNGEPPIKLFIRCVGDKGERVMVRVGGGWADLGEYLKEYASHHGRRGGEAKVEVRDLPRVSTASPPSRPASAMDVLSSPVTPLNVRKARRSIGSSAGDDLKLARQPLPKTPLARAATAENAAATPSSSGSSGRSRSSSRLSWTEEDSSLGMAGPKSKHIELSEERKAWVESAKEKVRLASGDQRAAAAALALANRSPASSVPAARAATPDAKLLPDPAGKFGELGKVGSTKRLFVRKNGTGTHTGNGFGVGK